MSRKIRISRREAFSMAAGAAGALVAGQAAAGQEAPAQLKGRIRQSVSRWCYGSFSLDDLCEKAKAMGLVGIDLLGPGDWETVKKHGLICTMATQIGSIPDGWNRVENHDRLVADAEKLIPQVKQAGLPNLITFSGNRRGLPDADGLENCARGLKRITKLAEDQGVNIVMELLNSKRSHKDYQCDHTAWGVELCKRVESERFKLLYDIFHMQIMEGDICDTIRENIRYIAHFHTGGVPGRNEIDETQELNYRRICRAIADSDFKGYVAHEFVPRRDPMASLRQAVHICDV
jgi:hydroxypyruvate isomerase